MFEVASIKPNGPGAPRFLNALPGGRFIAIGQPVKGLVAYAYRVRSSEVLGGPSWAGSDPWEIQAKVPEDYVAPPLPASAEWNWKALPAEPMLLMLQSLLEDRFKLRVHREERVLPIYELVVARDGPKIRLAEDQTPVVRPEPGPRTVGRDGPQLVRGSMRLGRGRIQGKAVPLSALATMLTERLGREVTNKTELDGLYDVDVQWTPDEFHTSVFGIEPESPEVTPIPGATTIFTAIQEQLGLRLISTKGPVAVIVIDSVEKPTEN